MTSVLAYLAVIVVLAVGRAAADLSLGTGVVAVMSSGNTIEVAARGADNAVHVTTVLPTSFALDSWKAATWRALPNSRASSHPAMGVLASSRMPIVLARGEANKLYASAMTTPTDPHRSTFRYATWSPWTLVDAHSVMGSLPVVGRALDGRLVVASLNANHNVQVAVEASTSSTGFTAWRQLAELASGVHALNVPVLTRGSDGFLNMVVIGTDFHLYQAAETAGAADDGGVAFSAWKRVATGAKAGADDATELTGRPAVAANSDGRLEVFVRTTDNHVVHAWQARPGAAFWSPWASFARHSHPGMTSDLAATTRSSDGIVEVAGRAADSQLYLRRQSRADGWTQWTLLGGSAKLPPVLVEDATGNTHVVAVSLDNVVEHMAMAADGTTTAWSTMPGLRVV